MAVVTSHMLVTRPVDLEALKAHIATALRVDGEWEGSVIGPFCQEHLAIQEREMAFDVLYSPDRAMPDPMLIEGEQPDGWFPVGVKAYASLFFEFGGPWGETPEQRLLSVFRPDESDPSVQAARRFHELLLLRIAQWLRKQGCEEVPWYIAPFMDNDENWPESWSNFEHLATLERTP